MPASEASLFPALQKALESAWIPDLDMREPQFNALVSALGASNGLIVFNGPTGSGKHRHIATALACLAKAGRHCATIEVSSRGAIPGVTGITVNSFNEQRAALDSAALEDHQVIYFREILHVEDLEAALAAATQGKLILTTMHAADSSQAWRRLLLLASQSQHTGLEAELVKSLRLLQSQRRLDRLCDSAASASTSPPFSPGTLSSDVSPNFRWPRVCPNCESEPLTGFKGDCYIYESRTGGTSQEQPGELVDNITLLDSALRLAAMGRVSPGDAYRCAAPGEEPLHDFSTEFLEFVMHEPPPNLAPRVFSLAVQEYTNYPRLSIEYCADPERLVQRELLVGKQGYFIRNESVPGDASGSIDFLTARGQLPTALVDTWFARFHQLEEELFIHSALERWQYILDAPFQEADYHGDFYSYRHCQAESLEEARQDYDCHTLEHVHAGGHSQAGYPILTLRYETAPTVFTDGWNSEARGALSALAEEILAQFEAAKPRWGAKATTSDLPAEIHRSWTHERYLRRVFELPIVRKVRRTDAPGGYYQ